MPKSQSNKPTPEELQADIDAALEIPEEELEKPAEEEAEEPVEETEDENAEVVETPDEEGEAEEATPDEEEQAEPSKELFKKKLSASARENQKIYAKNRVINQAIIEADEIPAPTDDEMKGIYGEDWELASDIEKESLRETQISRKWRAKIKEASDQATKIEKWNDSVNDFIEDPKTLNDNPELEGKTEEFRAFATEADNNSVPFNILVAAFLHESSKSKPANKGRMFERGKGGAIDKGKPTNGKISLEQARSLRETNYAKYKELLKAGKIYTSI